MPSIDGNYISELLTAGGNAQVDNSEFGSFSASFDDEFATRIFKIAKDDDEMLSEWGQLKDSIDGGEDENQHYLELRAPGGLLIAVVSSAEISGDRQEIINAILSAEDTVKQNTAGIPKHRCPSCGKPGRGKILGAVKTNSKGKTGKQHLVCDRCGARYKI
jgi:hypothetical protein